MYSSTKSCWVARIFLASSFSIVSWTLSINTFVDISASNQRQGGLLTAIPELFNCRLMEFRSIKSQFRTKFALNGNQDWRFSLGIGHVKSLTIWFPQHVWLGGGIGGLVGVYLMELPSGGMVFSLSYGLKWRRHLCFSEQLKCNPLRGLIPSGSDSVAFHLFRTYLDTPLRSKVTNLVMHFRSLTNALRNNWDTKNIITWKSLSTSRKVILEPNQHLVKF